MVEVKAQHDKQLGAYIFRFKYGKYDWDKVKGMIDVLKVLIPASDREYNPATKEWTILDASWPKFKMILGQSSIFQITEEKVIDDKNFHYDYSDPIQTTIPKATLAEQLAAMLGVAVKDLEDTNATKKAYRRKALEWHPDRNNGDGTKMSELNSVWSAYNA